jgi:hypothetical protein
MKVGDLVRCRDYDVNHIATFTGVVVSELRHGINRSFVDVLVDGVVISVNWKALEVLKLEVINESR